MIHVEGIGKRYQLGAVHHDTLWEAATHRLKGFFGRKRSQKEGDDHFWALKDVSFDVAEGEVVGIIGKNGAGKSTLLKILSRITLPTEGQIRLKGRVASLLEVGTGFHPELTGRENIFMNGAILGMSRQEIKRKFDEIVDFSEVEKFIDTPVKHYSSGMYVRLAFAVAAHLEPEILIVDEVLAVGDAEFQKKCLGKMGDVAQGGRTVLFVSHNMAAVKRLCSRGVLLVGGTLKADGNVGGVLGEYMAPAVAEYAEVQFDGGGSDKARLSAVRLVDAKGRLTNRFAIDVDHYIEIDYDVYTALPHHRVVLQLTTVHGEPVLVSTSADHSAERQPVSPGKHTVKVAIPGMFLNEGQYVVSLVFGTPGVQKYDQREAVISFVVEGFPFHYRESRGGVLCGALDWKSLNGDAL